jgi:sporulation protein YlmC with PRC-barrel domain
MKATQEIHLERLLGKRVVEANGQSVGRIEEVRAEKQGDGVYVQEYLLGPHALLERLSVWLMRVSPMRRVHDHRSGGYRVPWDQLDLTNPERPRLRCPKQTLQKL